MRAKIIAIIILINTCLTGIAQNDYTQKDLEIYERFIKESASYKDKPLNELILLTAKSFLGTPYVAATLEKNKEEQLVINLRELDCTTLVESVIALSGEAKKGKEQSFVGFMISLKKMRYRNGAINGYTSRIHYSSEWVQQNNTIAKNMTLELGGEKVKKSLSFMTTNSHLYPALKNNEANIQKMREIENSLNNKNSYTVLDKSKVKGIEKSIKDGDIILFATRTSGLDYSHMGIACWDGDVLKFLHASSAEKKVVIDSKSLSEYCAVSTSCTGITVLRLIDKTAQ